MAMMVNARRKIPEGISRKMSFMKHFRENVRKGMFMDRRQQKTRKAIFEAFNKLMAEDTKHSPEDVAAYFMAAIGKGR